MKTIGLGPNQRKILEILQAYPNSTIMEIARTLFPDQQVTYRGKLYTTTCRSINMLEERKLVERECNDQLKWHLTPKTK